MRDPASLLQKVAIAANEADTVEEALSAAVEAVCSYTGWPIGHAYLVEPGDRTLQSTEIWCLTDHKDFRRFRDATRETTLEVGVGLPGRVAVAGEAVWIEDVRNDPHLPRMPAGEDLGVRGAFGFPVLIARDVVGVLEFFSAEVEEPNDELLEIMRAVGVQVGRVVERQRAVQALAGEEARFRAVTDTAVDAIVSADDTGRITYMNGAAGDMFATAPDALIGEPLTVLMPERFHDLHWRGFTRYLETRHARVIGQTVELAGRRSTGEEFPIELSLGTWSMHERLYFTGIIRDITERKRSEADAVELRVLRERQARALEINDSIVQGLVVAKYALEMGNDERLASSLEDTLRSTISIVREMLRENPRQSFVRSSSGSDHRPDGAETP